jgi:CubicO group peptidase (beta-lactamase class C family)
VRVLPESPSLRYLKAEAKRRLAAGEFPALYQAQLAIAREHGQPSWPALRLLIARRNRRDGPALTQLKWVISRFSGAGAPGWSVPAADELREHFTAEFLEAVPPDEIVALCAGTAPTLRQELVVGADDELAVRARIADYQVTAVVEAAPPHRLTGLAAEQAGGFSDQRTARPQTRTSGTPPPAARDVVAGAFAGKGFVGLALAGGQAGPGCGSGEVWSAAAGWADLESGVMLSDGHRFPADAVTMLVTAVMVLRLVADGRVRLDDPANRHLRTVRLADDAATVRELLLHTGGVVTPPRSRLFGRSVPALDTVVGGVLACAGRRETAAPSPAGYAALGQLIADVTGLPYPRAAASMVLRPLSMGSSGFPARHPRSGAVTGYSVAPDGSFQPAPGSVSLLPAAGGLWATARDLARFGLGWSSLLPRALAGEALAPQAQYSPGRSSGLGWVVNEGQGMAGIAGSGPGSAASLLVPLGGGRAHAALANRQVLLEPLNMAVMPDRVDSAAQTGR